MKQEKLISLAMNFASFLVDRIKVDKIILFGSVASGTSDKESDIDLFVEVARKDEKKVKNLLELYKKSKDYEKYRLDGVENEILIKCRKLDDLSDLKWSIIANGVVLYGRFRGEQDKLEQKVLFIVDLAGKGRADKVRLWRRIYGYKQKVGRKFYVSKGLVEKKVGKGAFIVDLENSLKVKELLRKNRIKYELMDVWLG